MALPNKQHHTRGRLSSIKSAHFSLEDNGSTKSAVFIADNASAAGRRRALVRIDLRDEVHFDQLGAARSALSTPHVLTV